jgi:tetraacyldisaccharide 4'-kinase
VRAPDFWAPGPCSGPGKLARIALAPIGCVYGALTTSRATRPAASKAPVPVICVGNAVMGGAGKTQVCIDLVHRLGGTGRAPHVLSRGYGGQLSGPRRVDTQKHHASDVGDEALLLAKHAPTWIGADRTGTAQAATDAGAGLLIMDDGFQNPALHRDVNLLVIDGGYGFGNGLVFPAGPLRERAENAFARAHAVCIIGKPGPHMPATPNHIPVFEAAITPAPGAASLTGRKVVAFAGIGRPEKFFETLRGAGADIVKAVSFADHHVFGAGELDAILKDAEAADAAVLTTEKDHVRLAPAYRTRIQPFAVTLAWADGDALQRFILGRIGLN